MSDRLRQIRDRVHQVQTDIGSRHQFNDRESRRWADALKRGCIFFYGTREVEIGLKDIDWSGSHIDHQEWPAQLNRFFVLPHLADLYRETADAELPRLARALVEDWIAHHDYRADSSIAPGDNTLNMSIRVGQSMGRGWWVSIPEFADSGVFDEPFIDRMIESTRGQLAYLATHLTGVGNWRISQLDSLLFCSMVVPELADHQQLAVRGLNEAFHRQVHADGSHEEHNPSYHSWMREVFTQYWRLSQARPGLGLRFDPAGVVRMWDYSLASMAPDGGSFGLHDGGKWAPGGGTAATREQRRELVEETGQQATAWDPEAEPSRYFESAGQVFIRDSWEPDSAMVAFDATRWGGGHCHLSRNSVNLYAGGRMLLCDPGVFSYEMTDPFAPYGKSTPAHNTIHLEGLSQCESDPQTPHVHLFEETAVVHSIYNAGYWPGPYTWWFSEGRRAGTFAAHGRVMLWLRGRAAIVWDDLILDRNGQSWTAHWQFPAGPHGFDGERRRAWTAGDDANVLVQVLDSTDAVTMGVREGERLPYRGWLPGTGHGGDYQPAPQVAIEAITHSRHALLTTLLMPFRGTGVPDPAIRPFTDTTGRARGYELKWNEHETDLVVASPGLHCQIGKAGRITSDGSLVAIGLRDGRPTRVTLIDGLFVEYQGQSLVDLPTAGSISRSV